MLNLRRIWQLSDLKKATGKLLPSFTTVTAHPHFDSLSHRALSPLTCPGRAGSPNTIQKENLPATGDKLQKNQGIKRLMNKRQEQWDNVQPSMKHCLTRIIDLLFLQVLLTVQGIRSNCLSTELEGQLRAVYVFAPIGVTCLQRLEHSLIWSHKVKLDVL